MQMRFGFFALVALLQLAVCAQALNWCDIYSSDPNVKDPENRNELRLLSKLLGVPKHRLNVFHQYDTLLQVNQGITHFLTQHQQNCPNVFVRIGGNNIGTSFFVNNPANNHGQNVLSVPSLTLAQIIHAVGAPNIYISSCLCNHAAVAHAGLNVRFCSRSLTSPVRIGSSTGWLSLPPPAHPHDAIVASHYRPVQAHFEVSVKPRTLADGLAKRAVAIGTPNAAPYNPDNDKLSDKYTNCLSDISSNRARRIICMFALDAQGAVTAKMFDPLLGKFIPNPGGAVACQQGAIPKYQGKAAARIDLAPNAPCAP